jgi:hypothetical protein
MSTYSLPPIQSNYSSAFPHPNQPAFLPQSLADQSLDPNSPDVFKQNIQLVQQHVARVNSLARSALNGMLVIIESSRRGTLLNSYTESVHIMLEPHPHRQKVCLPNSPWMRTYLAYIGPTADIASLKQNLQMLSDLMRQTGVGALPLLPMPSEAHSSQPAPVLPTEEMMLTDTSRSVQVLYDRMKRSQESAAVVANLLSAPEHGGPRIGR